MVKNTYPTSMKTSQGRAKQTDEQNRALHQKYDNLQRQWDSINQSNPRSHRRYSTNLATIFSGDHRHLQLLSHSPRELMSSLQHHRMSSSPSEGYVYNARQSDGAAVETVRERLAAIESDKLKGRRLFEEEEDETEMGLEESEEICSECLDLVQESEVRTSVCNSCGSGHGENDVTNSGSYSEGGLGPVFCCCCCCRLGYSVSDERELVGEEREKRGGGGGIGGRWMIGMIWFGGFIMLFMLGIISIKCNGGDEVILGPT